MRHGLRIAASSRLIQGKRILRLDECAGNLSGELGVAEDKGSVDLEDPFAALLSQLIK